MCELGEVWVPFVTVIGRDCDYLAEIPVPGNLFQENNWRTWLKKKLLFASPCHSDGDSSFYNDLENGTSFRPTQVAGVSGIRLIPSGSSLTKVWSSEGEQEKKA